MTTTVQRAPRSSEADAVRLASELCGVESSAAALPSERDQNFLLTAATGEKFVVKIANAGEDFEFLELQNQLIRFLAAAKIDLQFPQIVATKSGAEIASFAGSDGQKHLVRLLTWLDGQCLAQIQPHGRKLLSSLGQGLGQMDAAMAGFAHRAAQRDFHWDLRNAHAVRDLIGLLPTARRPLVERFLIEW